MKHGKRYRAAAEALRQAGAPANLASAVRLVKQTAGAKFDETIVVSSHLGVDPRHSDQLVRGTVVLPHGTGKSLRVLVLCKGDKVREAEAAGADFAGAEERRVAPPWMEGNSVRGDQYMTRIAVPNFYFHVTTAYAILRHNGVDLGKRDFIGVRSWTDFSES